ncbi:MAG: hypothetical protein ABIN05_03810 [candidate division WOR-3 bacterium]
MNWARKFEIESKRDIEVQERDDGTLLFIPGDIQQTEKQTIIHVNKEVNPDKIYYKILRAYSQGFTKIILSGDLTDEQTDFIEMMHKRIVGLEIVEQKKNQIILKDLIKIDDIDIDNVIRQMMSFISFMGKDILNSIKSNVEIGDKIMDKNSLIVRNHNLAFKICNAALKDSLYLNKLKKTPSEILIISRIARHLDNIGINLIALSYLLNDKQTAGMKKFHYQTIQKTKNSRKIAYKYTKKWLEYFLTAKKAINSKDFDKISDLYINRFSMKFEDEKKDQFSIEISNIFSDLVKNTYLILREFIII